MFAVVVIDLVVVVAAVVVDFDLKRVTEKTC